MLHYAITAHTWYKVGSYFNAPCCSFYTMHTLQVASTSTPHKPQAPRPCCNFYLLYNTNTLLQFLRNAHPASTPHKPPDIQFQYSILIKSTQIIL